MSANFRWKGTSPPNYCWLHKTRVLLLPHSEDQHDPPFIRLDRVPACDRRTDGRTNGQTDGIAVGITALCIASNAAAL